MMELWVRGMRYRLFGWACFLFLVSTLGLRALAVVPWFPLGPYGGDARAIAQDPSDAHHLFLGTANGWIYESRNGGHDWARLAQIAHRNDLVIDHMLIDPENPKRLIVGTWVVDRPEGGLYVSIDGGKTWYDQAQMRGQSIRSLARASQDPRYLVAGTLKGVFRSSDNGDHWALISPPGSTEIHEVESVAIDPTDPDVIYAGTWHLPWKTTDGGKNWENIKNGIIDDSDVFSIIIDPQHPKTVYASACSGIYKSYDAGVQFRKINGIPSSARRTRKLTQDPRFLGTVYAGTTEGLYRTLDGGMQWVRLTGGDVIVNDVWVDPTNSQHLLLATDRGGVLVSFDGGAIFESSNTGFSARQVVSYVMDAKGSGRMYVGVVNDKTTGGVFTSSDGGIHWAQQSTGLGGRDVFSLASLPSGTVLAGTGHGVFRLAEDEWKDSSVLLPPPAPEAAKPEPHKAPATGKPATKKAAPATRGKVVHKANVAFYYGAPANTKTRKKTPPARKPVRSTPPPAPTRMDEVIYALEPIGSTVFAGTTRGIVRSEDDGASWSPVVTLAMPDARFLAGNPKMLLAATLKRMALSVDMGKTWDTVALPADLTQIGAVAVDELGNLWVGGREGVYYSTDLGENWKTLKNLFITQVDNIHFDALQHRILVTSSASPFAFSVTLPEYKVNYVETGWNLRFVRPVGDHLIGASLFDGMVVQPRMVNSKFGK
ncbi:hypothetical protein ACFQBQ_03665 [Granulicella cerasi]|uniref:Sortilin N-terminal domain-containing protein n=1 Tax=Granulicella cerasi TaxID=741063 RepID=A0ABW1Z5U4_9BACT|nr:hypothetical protein [Granulicella cerasi]